MAQRKIIWSHKAKIKLFKILSYYNERNKSNSYSKKLNRLFQKNIKLLVQHPALGIKTEIENVRALIVDNYIIYYEASDEQIIVHTIWDSRQNPDDLIIK